MTAEQPQAPRAPPKARALRPRDAATLIIVDSSSGEPRVLLGRRRLDMVFMPGRYVFPGGRVDPADKQIDVEEDLRPRDLEKLMVAMKGTPSQARARALALAAVRETFEEAGLLIGTPLGAGRRAEGADLAGLLRHRLPPGARPPDVLRARHHAARPPAPLRHALLLRAGRGHRPQDRRSRTGSCRTSNGIRSPRRARSSCPTSRASCWRTWASASPPAHCTRATFRCRSITAATAASAATSSAPTPTLTNRSQRLKCRAIEFASQPIKASMPWQSLLPRRSSC